MCLFLLARDVHPKFKTIIATNRDEYHSRPTEAAHWWSDHPEVFAGRDLKGGGTWFGITRAGRFAAITNFRGPSSHDPGKESRGKIVENFLTSERAPEAYLEALKLNADRYNPFNLVVGTASEVLCLGSRYREIQPVGVGIYGLSNDRWDTPWPKVVRGKKLLGEAIANDRLSPEHFQFNLETDLQRLLRDQVYPDDSELPDTRVGLEVERMLSPIFITSAEYGTRSSTVVLIGKDGSVMFSEATFGDSGGQESIVAQTFWLK